MKKVIVILSVFFILLTFTEATLDAAEKDDFEITNMWVVNRTGNVWVRVLFHGTRPFRGDVYFGIWFNNGIKRPVKKRLVFTNESGARDLIVCNFTHLKVLSGEGKLKVKVDATSQYREINEKNNVFEKYVHFAEISKIELKVEPKIIHLKMGKIKKVIFKAKFTLKGRGTVLVSYLKKYSRYRKQNGSSARKLINSTKANGPTFYSNLGVYGYKTKVETITWYKIESFDINAKHMEIQEGVYKVVAEDPNRASSNLAQWGTQYWK